MKYKCLRSFDVDKYEDEERDDEPIGVVEVKAGSIWERRRISSDYEVMLDECESGDWLGLGEQEFKKLFEPVN